MASWRQRMGGGGRGGGFSGAKRVGERGGAFEGCFVFRSLLVGVFA